MPDVEIYINNIDEKSLLGWISSVLEEVVEVQRDDEMVILSGVFDKSIVPVIIQKNVENLDLTGVWFNSEITPWSSDLECAREAFYSLNKTVLCDPGEEYPSPTQFLEISENGEKLITIE
ncbi:hypothetical protein [Microbulbifer guangxiensis]|uniref:hypothetical protein n=1 Tax=Microbulbifer guangxiensis TaxID=2904249 RepID=UPI001F23AB6B|nr:hypothetical protein [Microbulbifer guangxiensis]